jgi:phosphoglycerate dehydrogenase-like enzyme
MSHVHLHQEFMPSLGNAFDDASAIREMEAKLEGLGTLTQGETAPDATTILVAGELTEAHRALPNLQTVIVPYAGIPRQTAQFAAERGLTLLNLHFNAASTSEMAVGLLISAARGLAHSDKKLREGHWTGRHDNYMGVLLAGKTATVLGHGAIGQLIGETLRSLGMTVYGVKRQASTDDPQVVGVDQLGEVLEKSHALVVAAPLTPETKGLVGRRELLQLREPRLVVNIGRGPIIDEAALYELCASRAITAAGIDVWYQYPKGDDPTFPSKFPFHELDNVVLSPHRAGTGDDSEILRTQELSELLVRVLRGETLKTVTPHLGY